MREGIVDQRSDVCGDVETNVNERTKNYPRLPTNLLSYFHVPSSLWETPPPPSIPSTKPSTTETLHLPLFSLSLFPIRHSHSAVFSKHHDLTPAVLYTSGSLCVDSFLYVLICARIWCNMYIIGMLWKIRKQGYKPTSISTYNIGCATDITNYYFSLSIKICYGPLWHWEIYNIFSRIVKNGRIVCILFGENSFFNYLRNFGCRIIPNCTKIQNVHLTYIHTLYI